MAAKTNLRDYLHMDDQDDLRDVDSGLLNQVGKVLVGS